MILPTLSNGIQSILLDRLSITLVIWTVIFYARKIYRDPSAVQDFILFAVLEALSLSRETSRQNSCLLTFHLATLVTIWLA